MASKVIIGIWDAEHKAYRYAHSIPEINARNDELPGSSTLVYVSVPGVEQGVYRYSPRSNLTTADIVDAPYVVCERGGEVDMPAGTVVYISGFPGRKDGTYVVVEGSKYINGVVSKVLVPIEVMKE